jgi:hypothetical protein
MNNTINGALLHRRASIIQFRVSTHHHLNLTTTEQKRVHQDRRLDYLAFLAGNAFGLSVFDAITRFCSRSRSTTTLLSVYQPEHVPIPSPLELSEHMKLRI